MTKQEDFITCKQCGNTDPLTKEFKCSKCGAKNWGHQLPPKAKSGCLFEIITMVIFLSSVFIYYKVKEYRGSHWSQSRIESEFSKNMVLVFHEFAIEVEFDDPQEQPLYFVGTENGGFTQWQKGMQANSITGCGFITEANGSCITTQKIAQPRPTEWEFMELNREMQIFRNPPFNIKSKAHYKIFTIKLGYYPVGAKINDLGSFVSCKASSSWGKDIVSLSAQGLQGSFDKVTKFHYTHLTKIENGDKIFIIGFPFQHNPSEKLGIMTTQSTIDSTKQFDYDTSEFYYGVPSLYILEGSPVFNLKGDIIGLNTIDEKGNIKAIGTNWERKK